VTFTVNGKAGQVQTNAANIRVDGVLGDVVDDPKALRDSHGPLSLISRDWFWAWIGSALGSVLVLMVVGIQLQRIKRRKKTVRLTGGFLAMPRRRIDMTGEKALAALAAIKASGVLDRDDDRKQGYTEMVDVIRDYLGARYRVASRDLTSNELVRSLRAVAPDDELALIERWLERCDIVKYGAARVSAATGNTVLDDARALIVTTTQMREAAQQQTKEAA